MSEIKGGVDYMLRVAACLGSCVLYVTITPICVVVAPLAFISVLLGELASWLAEYAFRNREEPQQ